MLSCLLCFFFCTFECYIFTYILNYGIISKNSMTWCWESIRYLHWMLLLLWFLWERVNAGWKDAILSIIGGRGEIVKTRGSDSFLISKTLSVHFSTISSNAMRCRDFADDDDGCCSDDIDDNGSKTLGGEKVRMNGMDVEWRSASVFETWVALKKDFRKRT